MRMWKTTGKDVSQEDWSDCSVAGFNGNDPWQGKKKQCWCEEKPSYTATRCADDGGDCLCNGYVAYGALEMSGVQSPIDFYSMTNGQWTVNDANNTGNITCSKESFMGVDPLPGEPK